MSLAIAALMSATFAGQTLAQDNPLMDLSNTSNITTTFSPDGTATWMVGCDAAWQAFLSVVGNCGVDWVAGKLADKLVGEGSPNKNKVKEHLLNHMRDELKKQLEEDMKEAMKDGLQQADLIDFEADTSHLPLLAEVPEWAQQIPVIGDKMQALDMMRSCIANPVIAGMSAAWECYVASYSNMCVNPDPVTGACQGNGIDTSGNAGATGGINCPTGSTYMMTSLGMACVQNAAVVECSPKGTCSGTCEPGPYSGMPASFSFPQVCKEKCDDVRNNQTSACGMNKVKEAIWTTP